MKKLPSEYLFVAKDGKTYYKAYQKHKKEIELNGYILASIPVVFDKEATTEVLFKIIEDNPHLKDSMFYFDDFNKEFNQESEDTYEGKLNFYWWGIEVEDKVIDTMIPKMEVDMIDETGERYSIEFLSVNKLKNLKINVDPTFNIYDKENKPVYTLISYPTLFHILYGFFWEISFFGNPEDRENKSNELQESLKDIKKEFDIE